MRTSADYPIGNISTTKFYPCPRCGGTNISTQKGDFYYETREDFKKGKDVDLPDGIQWFWVRCARCRFGTDDNHYFPGLVPTKEKAIILWNRVAQEFKRRLNLGENPREIKEIEVKV